MRFVAVMGLLVSGVLLSGCLEQISTTRVPAGAAHNFFVFLTLDQQQNAETYWAPDYIPADSRDQISRAVAQLAPYEFMTGKSVTENTSTGATVTIRGQYRLKGSANWEPETDLLRAAMIFRGPGWRLTSFEVLCCGANATPTPLP